MDETRKRRSAIFQTVAAAITARLQEIGPDHWPEVANPHTSASLLSRGRSVEISGRNIEVSHHSSITIRIGGCADHASVTRAAADAAGKLVSHVLCVADGPVVTAMLPGPAPGVDVDVSYGWAGRMPVRLLFHADPASPDGTDWLLSLDACFGPVPAVPL